MFFVSWVISFKITHFFSKTMFGLSRTSGMLLWLLSPIWLTSFFQVLCPPFCHLLTSSWQFYGLVVCNYVRFQLFFLALSFVSVLPGHLSVCHVFWCTSKCKEISFIIICGDNNCFRLLGVLLPWSLAFFTTTFQVAVWFWMAWFFAILACFTGLILILLFFLGFPVFFMCCKGWFCIFCVFIIDYVMLGLLYDESYKVIGFYAIHLASWEFVYVLGCCDGL